MTTIATQFYYHRVATYTSRILFPEDIILPVVNLKILTLFIKHVKRS